MSERRDQPDPSPPPARCPNCAAPRQGEYCAVCGQHNRFDRLRLRELAGASIEHLLEADVPFIRTLIGMTIRPGRVCREYVEGKRRRYSNPLKYCFVLAALYVLVITVFDISPSASVLGEPEASGPVVAADPAGARPTPSAFADQLSQRSQRLVEETMNWLAFFSIPVAALVLGGLFRREQLTLAEHLVFAYLVFGHAFLFNLIEALVGLFATAWGVLVANLVEFSYATWAAHGFFGRGLLSTAGRILLVYLAYTLTTIVLAFGLVTAWITWQMVVAYG